MPLGWHCPAQIAQQFAELSPVGLAGVQTPYHDVAGREEAGPFGSVAWLRPRLPSEVFDCRRMPSAAPVLTIRHSHGELWVGESPYVRVLLLAVHVCIVEAVAV